MPVYSQESIQRFWSRVSIPDDDGCWPYEAGCDPNGYGMFSAIRSDGYRCTKAHRFSYEVTRKAPIPAGLFVCHTCDNPCCVHPAHLFLGTHQDNVDDARRKGRHAHGDRSSFRLYPELYYGDRHWARRRPELIQRGEDAPRTKLTEEQVLEVLKTVNRSGAAHAVAARYGVNYATIWDIVKRKTWAHLGVEPLPWTPWEKADPGERFWPKVARRSEDECWLWTGAKNKAGQAVFHYEGHDTTAPRISYLLMHGEIPRGHIVFQTCGEKLCVNPAHLTLGRPSPPRRHR